MQTDSVEKAAGVGAIGLWAAMHGWLGWLVVLYAACMMLDCLTGTAQAIKNGEWSSHKARQGLWHKGGSIIMVFVSVLTDILLGLTLNHISGITLPFNYDMLLTPIVLFWYIVSELGSILENAERMGPDWRTFHEGAHRCGSEWKSSDVPPRTLLLCDQSRVLYGTGYL